MCRFLSGLAILCHWSMCLFLFFNASTIIFKSYWERDRFGNEEVGYPTVHQPLRAFGNLWGSFDYYKGSTKWHLVDSD